MLHRFLKSEFNRNVLTLMTGTVIAQMLPFLFAPILGRLYSPSDFAVYGLYFSLMSLISVISAGRYELAVMVPEKDSDAVSVMAVGVGVSFVLNLMVLLVVFFFNSSICNILGNQNLSAWLYLVPMASFFMGISMLQVNFLNRKKAFKANATNKVYQKSSEGIFSLLIGWLSSFNGLIWGDLIGRLFLSISAWFQGIRAGFSFNGVNRKSIMFNLKRYKDYPLYNALPALLNSFSLMFPVFFISMIYSENQLGYFNFSRTILAAPLVLISLSISQVLFQQVADKKNNQLEVMPVVKGLLKNLFFLSIPMILILVFFGPWLFSVVFGSTWYESGMYTQILIFSYAARFIISPLSMVFPALEKIKVGSLWQFIYFIAVALLFLVRGLPIQLFLVLLTVVDVVMYLIYLFMILKITHNYDLAIKTMASVSEKS